MGDAAFEAARLRLTRGPASTRHCLPIYIPLSVKARWRSRSAREDRGLRCPPVKQVGNFGQSPATARGLGLNPSGTHRVWGSTPPAARQIQSTRRGERTGQARRHRFEAGWMPRGIGDQDLRSPPRTAQPVRLPGPPAKRCVPEKGIGIMPRAVRHFAHVAQRQCAALVRRRSRIVTERGLQIIGKCQPRGAADGL